MEPTAAVANKAAGLYIPRRSGLAGVTIPTPRATQRQLALEENVKGSVGVIRPEHRRA